MPRYPDSDDPAVLASRVRNLNSFDVPPMPDFDDEEEDSDSDDQ